MNVWVFLSGIALGSVRTEDSTNCLDQSAVEFELRETLGDETVDQMDLLVQLSGEESWQLVMTVRNTTGTIWNRIIPVEPVDCPYLTELVAQSFQRGITDLPVWGLHNGRRPIELGGVMYAALPRPGWFGGAIDLWIPAGPVFGTQLQLVAAKTPVKRVAPRIGEDPALVTYAGIQPEVGFGFNYSVFRVSTRAGFGLGWAGGQEFSASTGRSIRPRSVWKTDVMAVEGYLRGGVQIEVVTLGARATDFAMREIDHEDLVRVGLVVGITGPLKGSDGSRPER